MLGKVLKYDFKRLARQLLPLYAVTFMLAFANWGMQVITEKYTIFSIISGFVTMIFIILVVATVIGTFALCIRYFYIHLLKDEGYLTNTLPVSKVTLVSSKVITAMVYGVISCLVATLAIWIGFIHYFNLFEVIDKLLQTEFLDMMMGLKSPGSIIFFLGIMSLSYLSQILLFFLALALGQTQNSNKLLYSFLYGMIVYCIQQAISFVMIGILVLFEPNIMNTFNSEVLPPAGMLRSLYIMTTFTSLILITTYYYGTTYIFKKKLNLE